MSEDPQAPTEETEKQEPENAKIVIICEGNSPVPMYIDFVKITPFHLLALGEWLSLKGRQMIALAESAERNPGIVLPSMDEEMTKRILGVGGKK